MMGVLLGTLSPNKMKVLNVYAGLRWWWGYEERAVASVNSAQKNVQIEFWNWLKEYGFVHNPSLVWANENRDKLMPFYKKLKQKAKQYDVVLIHQTGGILPEVMADIPSVVVYSSTDDPDSSETCSFPFLDAADIVAHAAVNYDRETRLSDVFLKRGAKRCIFWPIGFYEEMFPSLEDFDSRFKKRDIDLIYVGHLKRGTRARYA